MKTRKSSPKKVTNGKKVTKNLAQACNISRGRTDNKPSFTLPNFGDTRVRNIGLGR